MAQVPRLGAALSLLVAANAAADRSRALALDQATPIAPIRAARCVVTPDGQYHIAGPWIDLDGSQTRANVVPVFDCLNPQSVLAPTEPVAFVSNDMTVSAEHAGAPATQVVFTWYCDVLNPLGERCLIGVSTFEEFRGCDDPDPSAGDTFIDGLVYDFGDLPNGMWSATINTLKFGEHHTLPSDGSGAYQIACFSSYEPLVLADYLFPIYSNTGDDDEPPTPRPGAQGPFVFEDNNPADGVFAVTEECYSYSSSAPPYEIGPAIIFSVRAGCACPGDVDDYGDVTLVDLALLLAAFGESYPLDYPCADVDLDGRVGLSDLAVLLSRFGLGC